MKYAFFGDSITEGQYVGAPFRWVDIVSRKLAFDFPEENNESFILGVSGETTRQGLERLQKQLQPLYPDVVYFQFGLNDCNYWQTDSGLPRVAPAGFQSNLEEMISRFRMFGARRVIIANNHRPNRPATLAGGCSLEESNEAYNEIIKNVSKSASVDFVDIYSMFSQKFGSSFEYLIEDGVHLSRSGHIFYAECVFSHIRR